MRLLDDENEDVDAAIFDVRDDNDDDKMLQMMLLLMVLWMQHIQGYIHSRNQKNFTSCCCLEN